MPSPPVLEDIKELIGWPATQALLEAFGGQTISIPGRSSAALSQVVGPDAAAKLSARYGGAQLYIAKTYRRAWPERNQRILRDYQSGVPVRRLAQKYELSDRQIRNILNSP